MDEKMDTIKITIDKIKKSISMYENDQLDEFTLKHHLHDAASVFIHAAITGKVRNFNHG